MNQEQLNSLARTYRTCGCQQAYETLYAAMEGLRETNRRRMRKWGYEDNDADTIFDEKFDQIIKREVTNSFRNLLSASLPNAGIDFHRKEKRRVQLETSLDAPTTNEPDSLTLGETLNLAGYKSKYGLADYEKSTEYEVMQKKKKAESITLIDFLLESTTDSLTTAIVKLYPYYDTEYALAKALGVHNMVVRRKLRALSRHYDANRFGDIRDYLAV